MSRLAGSAVAAICLFSACTGCDPAPTKPAAPAAPPAVPVNAARAAQRDVDEDVTAIGWVEAYSNVTIKPQIDGELIGVHFNDGDEVAAGQLLFTFDARPFEAALLLAESNLARDQALAADAAKEADRVLALFDNKQGSPRERDEKRADADAKAAQLRADEAELASARLRVEYCTIRSPVAGRTGSVMSHRGTITKANETALVEITQIAPIYVTFSVPERHLPKVRAAGDDTLPVRVSIPGDENGEEVGRLTFIDSTVDRSTGMVRLKATFSNENRRLWPGQYLNVKLTTGHLRQVVVVPRTAVQPGQNREFVFVIGPDDKVEARTVTTGLATESGIVITRGVAPEETVVTDGQLRLSPGTLVTIKNEGDLAATATQPAASGALAEREPGSTPSVPAPVLAPTSQAAAPIAEKPESRPAEASGS